MTEFKRHIKGSVLAFGSVIIQLLLTFLALHLITHYVFDTTLKEGQLTLVLVLILMFEKETERWS